VLGRRGRKEGVRSSIYSGNIIHDLSSYRPAYPPDLVGFERIHATEARPTRSRDVPCQLVNTRTIQGISTPPIHQYSATPIQTKNCTKSAEDFAGRLEPEDQGGEQAGDNSAGVRVSFSRLACIRPSAAATVRTTQAPQELPAQPMSLPQPSPPRVDQHHGMSLEGHFVRRSHPLLDDITHTILTPEH